MSDYEEADGELDLGGEPEPLEAEEEPEPAEEAEEAKGAPEDPLEDPVLRAANRVRVVRVVPAAERETSDRLQRLEAAQLLAMRAEQIAATGTHFAKGAAGLHDPVAIAYQELVEGRTPFVLRRAVAASEAELLVEEWTLRELALPLLPPPPGTRA